MINWFIPCQLQCNVVGGKPQNNPTLTANKSGLKPSKFKTTTLLESRGRQLSHGIPRLGHTFEIVL